MSTQSRDERLRELRLRLLTATSVGSTEKLRAADVDEYVRLTMPAPCHSRLKDAIRRFTVDVDNGNTPNGPCEQAIADIVDATTPHRFYQDPDGARESICRAMARMCNALAADTKELREAADEFFREDFTKP